MTNGYPARLDDKKKTAFDVAVEKATETFEDVKGDVEGVQILLKQAGVADPKIAEIRANPSMVALIMANPDLVTRLAEMYPASYAITYYEQRTAMGLGLPTETPSLALNPELLPSKGGFAAAVSPTGAQEYPGGVIVDQANLTVVFPPNDASIAGSPAWMAQIPRWNEKKMQTWTQTLHKMGYIESKKVDLATFTDAMMLYHKNRYLYGGGTAVDLSAGDKGVSKKDFGGILDPAVLDTEVRSYHAEVYGADDEPSSEELRRGREFLTKTALRLARQRGMEPADAASVASARAQQKFITDPATRKWQALEETDTSLHDSFVNLFQVLSQ